MKKVLIVFLLLFILAAFLASFLIAKKIFLTPSTILENSPDIKTESSDTESQKNSDSPNLNADKKLEKTTNNDKIEESGSGGRGGSSSSPGEPISKSEPTCVEKQISYSLKNFNETSKCNLFENNICVDKTVYCAADIQNFDSEKGGLFVLNIKFFDKEIGEHAQIQLIQKERTVAQLSIENFEAVLNLQGSEANKNVGCTFTTQQVPKKELCY